MQGGEVEATEEDEGKEVGNIFDLHKYDLLDFWAGGDHGGRLVRCGRGEIPGGEDGFHFISHPRF